jgi:hypothetical protein
MKMLGVVEWKREVNIPGQTNRQLLQVCIREIPSGKKHSSVYIAVDSDVEVGKVYDFELNKYEHRRSRSGKSYINFYVSSFQKI